MLPEQKKLNQLENNIIQNSKVMRRTIKSLSVAGAAAASMTLTGLIAQAEELKSSSVASESAQISQQADEAIAALTDARSAIQKGDLSAARTGYIALLTSLPDRHKICENNCDKVDVRGDGDKEAAMRSIVARAINVIRA